MLIDGILMALTDHSPPEALCVLRALGLGDLLTALPALRGLRTHFADARIVLAAPRGLRELAMLSGAVDEVAPTSGLGDICRLDRAPTLAVNLHGCGPQSIEHVLALRPEPCSPTRTSVIRTWPVRHGALTSMRWIAGALCLNGRGLIVTPMISRSTGPKAIRLSAG